MTVSLFNNQNGSLGNVIDAYAYPQFISAQRAPTSQDIYNAGTRWFNSVTSTISETTGFGTWNQAGGGLATTSTPGIVYLATLAQTESGGAPSSAYVSSANDVATALAAVVVGAGVPATTAQQGYVFLATNAEAAAGVLTTNYAINPGSLAFALSNSAALPIGNTTAGSGSFTILGIKGASFAATNFIGVGTLTLGTVQINNTNIATGDVILITRTGVALSTTLGELTYTISNGASFTVTSVILGTPGSTQTGDLSTFSYVIIRPT